MDGINQRASQIKLLERIVRPVLEAASENTLEKKLSSERQPTGGSEAFCRCLAGISPWLELPEDESREGNFREEAAGLIGEGLRFTPSLNLHRQNLVEGGFLALGLLRAPSMIWGKLNQGTRCHILECLSSTRAILPSENNWVVFSGAVEAAIQKFSGKGKSGPVLRALKKCEGWYLGNGAYKDGKDYHFDYYNSIIILPFLLETLENCQGLLPEAQRIEWLKKIQARARKHAEFLENLISPEGTFPIIGRSKTYRFGALHLLAACAWKKILPEYPGERATRSALTQVMRNMTPGGTFTREGWLSIGVVGSQTEAGDHYINTGSLYACCLGFAALGLPPNDNFWQGREEAWTQKSIWAGEKMQKDQPFKEKEGLLKKASRLAEGKWISLKRRLIRGRGL